MIANINGICYKYNLSYKQFMRQVFYYYSQFTWEEYEVWRCQAPCPNLAANTCQGQCMNFIFPILNHPLVTFVKFTCYPRQVTMDLNLTSVKGWVGFEVSSISSTKHAIIFLEIYKQHYSHLKHLQTHYL